MTRQFVLQTAAWTLIHFVWQGAAIAGAASVLLRATRWRSAGTRYGIACVALTAMMAAPLVTARLMWSGMESARSVTVVQGDDAALTGRVTSSAAAADA